MFQLKIIFFPILYILTYYLNAQSWQASNGNLYTTSNVGVGISTPEEIFHIKASGKASAILQSETTNAYWVSDIGTNNGGGLSIKRLGEQKAFVYWTNNSPSKFGIWVNGMDRMVIDNAGAVGIGTSTPDPLYKLSVNGTIRSKEIKVETGWSDFVFKPNYDLLSIHELELYIKNFQHLPGIPDEFEVLENGVLLGEMNAKLLQKIEELTLYLIEQNKEIEQLKLEVSNLKEN